MVSRTTELIIVLTCLFVVSVQAWFLVRRMAEAYTSESAETAVAQAPPAVPPPVTESPDPGQSEEPDTTEPSVSTPEVEPLLSTVERLRARDGATSFADPREVTAMNSFLWGVYPYLCIVLFFVVPIVRMITRPFSWSTRASGLFGHRLLGVASVLFHWGLVLVLLGHVIGLIGGVLGSVSAISFFYWSGLVGGLMVLAGSVMALYRRWSSPSVRAMSQREDYIVHLFIISIVGIALYQVLVHRIFGVAYGASSWAASLWTLSPQPALMGSASLLSKLHVLLALTFFAYFPFTKLVHFWTFPVNYFVRPHLSMRTQRYRFQRRWELAWRSDKSWLTYGLAAVAVVFLISGLLLGKAKPSLASGMDLDSIANGSENGSRLSGYPLYVSQCARCHGIDGRGAGPGANSPTFSVPPRDLVYQSDPDDPDQDNFGAQYHFVSTDNGVASDDDLYRTIYKGLGESGMPAFSDLTDDQIVSLIDVLNEFRSEYPSKPGRAIVVPADPGSSVASITRGGVLFAEQCATCHGATGQGDGEKQVIDYLGETVIPADLAAGKIKSADSAERLFLRITAGIPGGYGADLMTKFDTLSEADRWALVHYLKAEILPAGAITSEDD